MTKPTFLVTNDDGIQVFFLRTLVTALKQFGTVFVAAPKREQSWVGRSVSRNREVKINSYAGFSDVQAWEIDGTPSDAVNIALGHLLPAKPDVVVSGINVGWNAMVPVLYSSGTVAGALEGASWGIPAIALSMHLEADDFDAVKEDSINPSGKVRKSVTTAAQLGAKFTSQKVGEKNENCEVYNVNFPTNPQTDTPWVATQPGKIRLDSFFENKGSDTFKFQYQERIPESQKRTLLDDFEVFSANNISVSILNFNDLGREFKL
jgi:5'-nucleotidase